MRDYVEIGIGREARRTWHLEDVSLVPTRRTRSSKDVDTTWHIDAYTFDIPVANHPTDALADVDFVSAMHAAGGLGVINAEGLIGRHVDLDMAIAQVIAATAEGKATKVLQELHSAPIDRGLLRERIQQIRHTGATVSVRVSPQNARELAELVVSAGTELLFIQGTIISAEHVGGSGEDPINLKDFIGSLDVPVIAGAVSDASTAMHLMRTGAAGIIVGSGSTTSASALGIDVPLATAIADAAAVRREYMDETGGRYVHVLADGRLRNSGDIAKAIACGADAVLLGEPLAAAEEAAATGYFWQSSAAHPRFPRGEVTLNDNCATLEVLLNGPSDDPLGQHNLIGGLRRAMAKCGYTDLKSFQKVELRVAR